MKDLIHSIDVVKYSNSDYGYYAVNYVSGKTEHYDMGSEISKDIQRFMEKPNVHGMNVVKDMNGNAITIHEYRNSQYDFRYCALSTGDKYRVEYFTDNMQTIVKCEYVYAESEDKAKELASVFIQDIKNAKYYEVMKCA